MQILYIINSYSGNGFSFQTRSKSINGQMSIECIIAKMTNLGAELLFDGLVKLYNKSLLLKRKRHE
jgi:hypothetical protein